MEYWSRMKSSRTLLISLRNDFALSTLLKDSCSTIHDWPLDSGGGDNDLELFKAHYVLNIQSIPNIAYLSAIYQLTPLALLSRAYCFVETHSPESTPKSHYIRRVTYLCFDTLCGILLWEVLSAAAHGKRQPCHRQQSLLPPLPMY
jgi:hypothetical protein